MTRSNQRKERVLAIDPTSRGFGYVLFEEPTELLDWAVVETKASNDIQCLKRISELIQHYAPDVVALENHAGRGSRRRLRARKLIDDVRALAANNRTRTRSVSRAQVRSFFLQSNALTKHEIAMEIAKRLPELAPRLPRFRKPWMTEDARMSIFDAASFALTYFTEAEKPSGNVVQ